MGTESFCNGWPIAISPPICEPATVFIGRTAPFSVPSVLRISRKAIAISVPAGQPLNYGGRNVRNRTYAYIGTRKRCGECALKAQCTSGAFRFLAIHMEEPARQRARELANTPEFAKAQRQRKKVEALFAQLK